VESERDVNLPGEKPEEHAKLWLPEVTYGRERGAELPVIRPTSSTNRKKRGRIRRRRPKRNKKKKIGNVVRPVGIHREKEEGNRVEADRKEIKPTQTYRQQTKECDERTRER